MGRIVDRMWLIGLPLQIPVLNDCHVYCRDEEQKIQEKTWGGVVQGSLKARAVTAWSPINRGSTPFRLASGNGTQP